MKPSLTKHGTKAVTMAEKEDQMTIDTTNMCSHLQKKLFEEDGIYHPLWLAMQDEMLQQ